MSSLEDPPRLTDADAGGSAFLRDLVRAAQQDAPSDATAASIARRVAPLRQGTSLAPSGPGAPVAGSATLPVIKASAVVLAGALIVLGVKWARSPQAPLTVSPSSTSVASTGESAPAAPEPLAPSAAMPEPVPAASASASASAASPLRATAREIVAPGASSAAPADDLEADVLLVQRAQDALRSNPASALALTAEHARRFPRSTLYQEREMITIEALTRSGRTAQARARAERFVQQFPRSPNRRRLETLFGTGFEVPAPGGAGSQSKRP